MKTMIVSDFAALRSALLQLVGICLVVSLFMSYVMGAVGTSAAIGAMIPFMCLFSLAALDEQNGWERFRLTLPITRRQVVFGRYASVAIATVLAFVFSLALSFALLAVMGLLPAAWVPESLAPAENPPAAIVGATVGSVGIVMIAMVVALPLIMRFGMTKAARIVPLIVVIVIAGCVSFFDADYLFANGLVSDLVAWLDTDSNYLVAAGATLAAVAILYIASAFLSAKLYEGREF